MARKAIPREDFSRDDYRPYDYAPQSEAWIGRLRYVVVPIVAVLAIAAAIYFLDDTRGASSVGASTAVNIGLPTDGSATPRVGYPAPDFTLFNLEGKLVKLSDFRGQTIFLNFFATWCPPCRAEMPDIVATYQEQQANGVVVLAVDMQEDANVVSGYASSAGLDFPIVLDRTGAVSVTYRISAIPTSFFIDKDGIIRVIQIGAMSKKLMQENLRKTL